MKITFFDGRRLNFTEFDGYRLASLRPSVKGPRAVNCPTFRTPYYYGRLAFSWGKEISSFTFSLLKIQPLNTDTPLIGTFSMDTRVSESTGLIVQAKVRARERDAEKKTTGKKSHLPNPHNELLSSITPCGQRISKKISALIKLQSGLPIKRF